MRLSGILPVMGRRVVVALGVAGMLMVASAANAQTAAAAPAAAQPEAPDPLKFTAGHTAMILMSVKQGQEATFEQGINEMKAGLAASAKPEHQAQAKSMVLMKVDAPPPPDQPVLFLLFLDPAVEASYDIVKTLYYSGAFDVATPEARKKVDDLYAKFTASVAGQNVWPLIKK